VLSPFITVLGCQQTELQQTELQVTEWSCAGREKNISDKLAPIQRQPPWLSTSPRLLSSLTASPFFSNNSQRTIEFPLPLLSTNGYPMAEDSTLWNLLSTPQIRARSNDRYTQWRKHVSVLYQRFDTYRNLCIRGGIKFLCTIGNILLYHFFHMGNYA
jgi:hypothetical protein